MCHGLNLTTKNSIKILPKELIEFVSAISQHFSSLQKRASLKRIQEENQLPTLYPIKLVNLFIGFLLSEMVLSNILKK